MRRRIPVKRRHAAFPVAWLLLCVACTDRVPLGDSAAQQPPDASIAAGGSEQADAEAAAGETGSEDAAGGSGPVSVGGSDGANGDPSRAVPVRTLRPRQPDVVPDPDAGIETSDPQPLAACTALTDDEPTVPEVEAPAVCNVEAPRLPTPTYAAQGEPCAAPGALACAAANQQQAVVCMAGSWQLRETCGANQNCDGQSGVCSPIVEACADRSEGGRYCEGEVAMLCNLDRTAALQATCCGRCSAGECLAPECGDGLVHAGEQCDDGNDVSADGCEIDCTRSRVAQLSAGPTHTCALTGAGDIRCWGDNSHGQLGQGADEDFRECLPFRLAPVALGRAAAQVATGARHTCALLEDGSVRCWGDNSRGQLGLGNLAANVGLDGPPDAANAEVPLGAPAIAIRAGGTATCAIMQEGSLRCWGENRFGQLGLGHANIIGDDEAPEEQLATVPLDGNVVSVGLSNEHACALLEGSRARCWGRNDLGQLGFGHTNDIGDDELPTDAPVVDFSATHELGAVVVGDLRSCVMGDAGTFINCWGYNDDGSLGLGFIGNPGNALAGEWTALTFSEPNLGLAAGSAHACIHRNNARLLCYGLNFKGQLGREDLAPIGDNEPIGLVPLVDLGVGPSGQPARVEVFDTGALHTCAWLETSELRCWGHNSEGQLGLGYVSPPARDFVGGTPESLPVLLDVVRVFQ